MDRELTEQTSDDMLQYTQQAEHRIGELFDLCQKYRVALVKIKSTCSTDCVAYWLAHDALEGAD